MLSPLFDELPLPQKLALAHCPAVQRDRAIAAFALDARIGKFIAQASEPLVAQLRLAWWREQLGKPVAERPAGDSLLDLIGINWAGHEGHLVALVDGWERLLGDPPLPEDALAEFVAGRTGIFSVLASGAGRHDATIQPQAERAGRIWGLADLALGISDEAERELVIGHVAGFDVTRIRLPFRLRYLTILGEIGRASLKEAGKPLLSRRRDYLRISRIGLLGF